MSRNEQAKHFNWLSIPPDERIIDGETMQWFIENKLPLNALEAPVSDELPSKPKKGRFSAVEVTSESKLVNYSCSPKHKNQYNIGPTNFPWLNVLGISGA